MADQVSRSAARWATVVAVPVTVLAAVLAFTMLNGWFADSGTDQPDGTASPTAPAATGPVPMAAPALSPRTATVCRALLSQLPGSVQTLAQRPVTAGAEQNAAYGDPAITLACGGSAVPTVPPTDTVFPLSGVCWYSDKRTEATVWTTLDREVPVTVTVPNGYDSPGQWVIEFSGPVLATVPPAPTPFGCRTPTR